MSVLKQNHNQPKTGFTMHGDRMLYLCYLCMEKHGPIQTILTS